MLWHDIRYAIRSYSRTPALTLVAIGMLVLGVGLNTAVFTYVNATLIRPFPYPHAERVVTVWEMSSNRWTPPGAPLTAANFDDIRRGSTSFESLSASKPFSVELSGDTPMRVPVDGVLPHYFRVLGVLPALGRTFDDKDYDAPQASQPYQFRGPPDGRIVAGLGDRAIISYPLWQGRFGGDPDAIGDRVVLDGGPVTIIGVMPPDFQPISSQPRVDMWLPFILNAEGWANRPTHQLFAVARLRRDINQEQASAEIAAIYQGLETAHPFTNDGWSARLLSLQDSVLGSNRSTLPLLLCGAGLVLLIACGNVAGLLMAKATKRKREIATRVALGASFSRVLRQLLVESTVLGIVAGLLSLLVSLSVVQLFSGVDLARDVPFRFEPRFDGKVFLFAFVLSIFASLAFGLAPAYQARRFTANVARARGASRMSQSMVVFQIALTVVLLFIGGLLLRSLTSLDRVDLGFRPKGLLSLALTLPESRYDGGPSVRQFRDRLVEQIKSLPDVSGIATASEVPFAGLRRNFPFRIEGRQSTHDEFNAMAFIVSEDYFRVTGIPLVRGRVFNDSDSFDGQWVAIINETLAREYWPGEDPIGKQIRFQGAPKTSTVVGIVKDATYDDPWLGAERQLYVPHRQLSEPSMFLLVRATNEPSPLLPSIREVVHQLDPQLPVYEIRTVQEMAYRALEAPRTRARMFELYALM